MTEKTKEQLDAEASEQAKKDAEAAAAKATKHVVVRVLQSCEYGDANDVVEVPADMAKAAEAAGLVDSHKAAVAYARTLPQNQPTP